VDVITGLLTAGVLGTVLTAVIALVRIAISAERRRADDWRTAAQTSAAANAILGSHVEKLITSVEQLATSQRETMTLLQTMTTERRNAA
jgi:hypothetical protein